MHQLKLLELEIDPLDYSQSKMMIPLSGGINSAAVLCFIGELHPKELHLYYSHFKEHSPDTFKFVKDCIYYARRVFKNVKVKITRNSVNAFFIKENIIPHPSISPCSVDLKIIPRELYCKEHSIDTILVGFVASEKRRMNRQVTYGDKRVQYPLIGIDDADCFALVKNTIGWYPAIYDIKDDNGKQTFKHNNCASGDTRFVTSTGIKTLKECAGQEVRVINHRGNWTAATVQEFGKQCLYKITLGKHTRTKIIHATEEHLWFVKNDDNPKKEELVSTVELKQGNKLVSSHAKFHPNNTSISAFGIAHGIVYGDGTHPHYYQPDKKHWNPPVRVVLCGEKAEDLLRFFGESRNYKSAAGTVVDGLPHYFKKLPDISESKSYLYGFLSGYIATDGCVDDRGRISLDFVRDISYILGIPVIGITTVSRKGYNAFNTDLHTLSFEKSNILPLDFFLRRKHRERIQLLYDSGYQPLKSNWQVLSVEKTDRIETVYCAIVPIGNAFVLEDNVLTHNCLPCKNMSLTQLKKVAQHFPKYAALAEETSKKTNSYWGRDDVPDIFKCDTCERFS